jgi:ABC-type transport system involved in multi-copper enzyme maturation permease subunit
LGNNKSSVSSKFVLGVSLTSFSLAVFFFWLSDLVADKIQSLVISFVFLLLIILIGILADIIGVSVTAAHEAPLHARAAKKVAGAQEGVFLVRNADRVANIMNDVVGDIAGTVSGALGIALALQLITRWSSLNHLLLNMFITALIAALTVGGKAAGKRIAIIRANDIIFGVGQFIAGFRRITGLDITGKNNRNGSR